MSTLYTRKPDTAARRIVESTAIMLVSADSRELRALAALPMPAGRYYLRTLYRLARRELAHRELEGPPTRPYTVTRLITPTTTEAR